MHIYDVGLLFQLLTRSEEQKMNIAVKLNMDKYYNFEIKSCFSNF